MPYTITDVTASGPDHVSVRFNVGDGRPDDTLLLSVSALRRRVWDIDFARIFPIWLACALRSADIDPRTMTRAQFRSFLVGKEIRCADTRALADAEEASLP